MTATIIIMRCTRERTSYPLRTRYAVMMLRYSETVKPKRKYH